MKVGSTRILEQEFNGLNWRTAKRADTGGSAGLDEERTFAYSAGWQLLEERVDSNYVSAPGIDKRVQYAWGKRYIDDCAFHRADVDNDGDYDGLWYHIVNSRSKLTHPRASRSDPPPRKKKGGRRGAWPGG